MRQKYKVKVGDRVKVISGNHKGSEGEVISLLRKNNRVVIKDVNMIKKHRKPTAQNPEGAIVETEGSIHVSNVAVMDSKGIAGRIGYKFNKDGEKIRFVKKSGEELK